MFFFFKYIKIIIFYIYISKQYIYIKQFDCNTIARHNRWVLQVGIFCCHEKRWHLLVPWKRKKKEKKNPIIVNYWYNFLIEVNLFANQVFEEVVSFSKHIQLDYKERTWGASGLLLTSLIRSKVQFIHLRNKMEKVAKNQNRGSKLDYCMTPRHLAGSS